MAPMIVERWEAEDGLGPYTTRKWPVTLGGAEFWSSDLDMTEIPDPKNDGVYVPLGFNYLCACLPSNPAWSAQDILLLRFAGYRHMRYAVMPKDVREGVHQVVFNVDNWLWKEQVSYRGRKI